MTWIRWVFLVGLVFGGCAERANVFARGMAAQDTGGVVSTGAGESCEDEADREKRVCVGGCELQHGASCIRGCTATYAASIRACNGETVDAGAWQQPVATPSQKVAAEAATKNAARAERSPGGWPLAGY